MKDQDQYFGQKVEKLNKSDFTLNYVNCEGFIYAIDQCGSNIRVPG